MKKPIKLIVVSVAGLILLVTVLLLVRLSTPPTYSPQATVSVRSAKEGYKLFYDQKPYDMKGVAGYTHLPELREVGGNTIRTWDTQNIRQILNEADSLNIKVIVGLPVPDSRYFNYHDDVAVDEMIESMLGIVNTYKDHPALLLWGVGNEVVFYPNSFRKLYAYSAINTLSKRIKQIDPNHPTTTMSLYSTSEFFLSQILLPNIDILSYNTFGRLDDFVSLLNFYLSNKPFIISEWGINGPWEEKETVWGAPIENSSENKGLQVIQRSQNILPTWHPKFLGSMLFYWGHKFEITPTWFSTFTQSGQPTELYSTINHVLREQTASDDVITLDYIRLQDQGPFNNVLVKSRDTLTAKTVGSAVDTLHHTWELLPESIEHLSTLDQGLQPQPIPSAILKVEGNHCQLVAPSLPGAYRLYTYVEDKNGMILTANFPFYVTY